MKTLEKFFKIIELLENDNNLKLQDISNILNINKSTVHRFISVMLKYNFVTKNEENGKYSLGLRFLNIATKIIDSIDIREIAHPYLTELEKITGETIHLTTFDGKNVVYIDKIESEKPIRMYSKIGNIAPMHCTAVGKVILAFQKKEKINEIIKKVKFVRYTKNTITNEKEFRNCLEEIRKHGYAVDDCEHEEGICCIAIPIRDYSKRANSALSVSALVSRMNLSNLLSFKDVLLEKGNLISESLGFKASNIKYNIYK